MNGGPTLVSISETILVNVTKNPFHWYYISDTNFPSLTVTTCLVMILNDSKTDRLPIFLPFKMITIF